MKMFQLIQRTISLDMHGGRCGKRSLSDWLSYLRTSRFKIYEADELHKSTRCLPATPPWECFFWAAATWLES